MKRLFDDKRQRLLELFHLREREKAKKSITKHECPFCKNYILQDTLRENAYICQSCQAYLTMPAFARIDSLCDEGSFRLIKHKRNTANPLRFFGYDEKLDYAKQKTGLDEAVVIGVGKIGGIRAALGVMDSRFMMASMGCVVGERLTNIIEFADKKALPLILVIASGGARMQEGIFSLMQMVKTTQAIERYKQGKVPYISVLTHPTTGGVWASFASIADVALAEDNALIGFAGPRVIEKTIGETLPEGFQKSAYQLECGSVDCVISREKLRETLAQILRLHQGEL